MAVVKACRHDPQVNLTYAEMADHYDIGILPGWAACAIGAFMAWRSWHALIGDPTYADAILDRLVHNAHRIDLADESIRKTRSRSAKKD